MCPSVCAVDVHPSVCQSQVCLHDNLWTIQARITKFGPKEQLTLTFKVKFILKIQIYSHFGFVWTITHHPFKLGSPNLDQRCILAVLRSLSILGLIYIDLQSHFQFWKLFFLPNLFICTVLVRASLVIDQIGFGFWLNIRFAVTCQWTLWSIIHLAIDLIISKDRYCLWITAVPWSKFVYILIASLMVWYLVQHDFNNSKICEPNLQGKMWD